MLITNSGQKNRIKEFVDQDHVVMEEYYDVLENGFSQEEVLKLMYQFIKRDPDFFDPYTLVVNILLEQGKTEEAAALLKTAYERALIRIVDVKGRWPKFLRWGFFENRHIMRIIDRYALFSWETGNTEEALTIFRQLLKANLKDNLGARYYILAIRMGLSCSEWDKPFESKHNGVVMGLDGIKTDKWFESNAKKFPEEFQEFLSEDSDCIIF